MQGGLALNAYAGIVSGVLALFFVYALSLLIVSQAGLHEYLPYVLGSALAGVVIGSIVNSLLSRIPFGLVGPETVLTAVLFLFVGSIYRSMAEIYSPEFILPTILAGMASAAVVTGLSLLALGKFKLGEYVRYIPLQIIGGVIGGVGVLALLGTLDWMAQLNLDWSNIYSILVSFSSSPQPLEKFRAIWPSLAFGLVIFLAMFRSKNSLFPAVHDIGGVGRGLLCRNMGRQRRRPVACPAGSFS